MQAGPLSLPFPHEIFYLRLFLRRQLIVNPAEDYHTNPTLFSKRYVAILAIINILCLVCVPSSGVPRRPLRPYPTSFPDPVASIAIYIQARNADAVGVECAVMQWAIREQVDEEDQGSVFFVVGCYVLCPRAV